MNRNDALGWLEAAERRYHEALRERRQRFITAKEFATAKAEYLTAKAAWLAALKAAE